MEKRLPLFAPHLRVGIAEDEAYSREEITLSRTISSDYNVQFRREGIDDSLILVTLSSRQPLLALLVCPPTF